MRVYTEVIFEWDEAQGRLVETSSQSEEYSGEVALCEAYTGNGWKHYPKKYFADTTGDGKYDGEIYISYYVNGSHRMPDGSKQARITEYNLRTKASNGDVLHWIKKATKNDPLFKKHTDSLRKTGTYALDHDEAAIDKLMGDAAKEFNTRGGGYPMPSVNWTPDRKEGDTEASITSGDNQAMDDLGVVPAAAEDSLRLLTEDWGRIATGDSEYHRTVQAAIDDLARAGQGVEGETYTDPATGDQVDVLGTLEREQQAYATSVGQAKEDFESERDIAVTGINRTFVDMQTNIGRAGDARDTGLEAAREGFTPAIRQAEAASAATGFAGTGVGEVAREALSEQLMGNVEAVETGFTETRSDLQLGGQRAVEDFVTGMEGLVTGRDRAVESAGTALGGAEANFAGLKANLDQIKTTQHKAAQNALRGIQTDMAAIIADTRTTMDNEEWDPFTITGSSLADQGGSYGWLDPGFDPTEAENKVTIEGMG